MLVSSPGTQDGYIQTSLHKAIAPEKAKFQYVNFALWEIPVKFLKAIQAMREQGMTSKLGTLTFECFPSFQVHLEMC